MFTTRPEILGTFAVATATHWLAAQTATSVLERGGNAFDAAAATVAQVLTPAIDFARHGFPLVPQIVQAIAAVKPLFETEWTTLAALCCQTGGCRSPAHCLPTRPLRAPIFAWSEPPVTGRGHRRQFFLASGGQYTRRPRTQGLSVDLIFHHVQQILRRHALV